VVAHMLLFFGSIVLAVIMLTCLSLIDDPDD
jgi:hypothetical protein